MGSRPGCLFWWVVLPDAGEQGSPGWLSSPPVGKNRASSSIHEACVLHPLRREGGLPWPAIYMKDNALSAYNKAGLVWRRVGSDHYLRHHRQSGHPWPFWLKGHSGAFSLSPTQLDGTFSTRPMAPPGGVLLSGPWAGCFREVRGHLLGQPPGDSSAGSRRIRRSYTPSGQPPGGATTEGTPSGASRAVTRPLTGGVMPHGPARRRATVGIQEGTRIPSWQPPGGVPPGVYSEARCTPPWQPPGGVITECAREGSAAPTRACRPAWSGGCFARPLG